MVTLVIGGARSGKSGFALARASSLPGRKAYVATAQSLDDEMSDRISCHRKERSAEWETIEEPLALAEALEGLKGTHSVVLIDCLTLWLSNMMLAGLDAEGRVQDLVSSLNGTNAHMFLVANEVGMGIVPDNAISRRFRDLAGLLNQKVASVADEVYLVAAGLPLCLKGRYA